MSGNFVIALLEYLNTLSAWGGMFAKGLLVFCISA